MANFIEVLRDGLTVERTVRRSGDRVQVQDTFSIVSKKAQAKRWGKPRYREITRTDFLATGGSVVGEDEPSEEPVQTADDRVPDAPAEVIEVVNQFEALEGLNVEDTLKAIADFSDEKISDFVEYEVSGQARVTLLEALGFGAE